MNVYVASSWRNPYQPDAVAELRSAGHEVYDFREDGFGFGWQDVDPNWKGWSPAAMREALFSEQADEGYRNDMEALLACDACVLVMPCGKSAHLELGAAIGLGKVTIVVLSDGEPELMWRAADHLCVDIDEAIGILDHLVETASQKPPFDPMLGMIAARILGEHAKVRTTDLAPLPAWKDLDGMAHPPTPVLRVDVMIDDKSFGMEGPAISAPGMVAYIATQLKGSELASPIIAPPAGFKA